MLICSTSKTLWPPVKYCACLCFAISIRLTYLSMDSTWALKVRFGFAALTNTASIMLVYLVCLGVTWIAGPELSQQDLARGITLPPPTCLPPTVHPGAASSPGRCHTDTLTCARLPVSEMRWPSLPAIMGWHLSKLRRSFFDSLFTLQTLNDRCHYNSGYNVMADQLFIPCLHHVPVGYAIHTYVGTRS